VFGDSLFQPMQKLVKQISQELEKGRHCAIYCDELTRVWPERGKRREKEVMEFAERHGWRLRFYKDDLCAIFDKPKSDKDRHREQMVD
jgi:hypothetical protein